MAADASTAMTIDFLRARLLSERSVSRIAKQRADQLAKRVAELEEQLRTVTTQRRKAERVATEVLAILESQSFGRLSDAADSGSDTEDTDGPEAAESGGGGGKARGEAEDAFSGSELGGLAAAPQAAGLSWKGCAASPDLERRQTPQQKGRQLRQRHSHSHRRSYIYMLTGDPSPKYQPGQSCRKIKRKELRLQTEGEEGKDNAVEIPEEGQEGSDCTVCTDEQRDLDGEVSQDGRGYCGDGRVGDGSGRYAMEKAGEMERVLEKQAELIGHYEAEENAQREWEKKLSESRYSTADDVDRDNKQNLIEKACDQRGEAAQIMDSEVVCEELRDKNPFGINCPSECLSNGSLSGLSPNAPAGIAVEQCLVVECDHSFGQATAAVASIDSESQLSRSCTEIIEGNGNNLGRSAPKSSPNAGHSKGEGDENSASGSSYHANARSSEHYITISSVGSTLSDTPNSKVSEWSSPCFHKHTDNQIDTQLYQPTDDVGGVLEALQRAKMSLREKLSRPSPPSQDMLALPAPEDRCIKDDLPINDTELPQCRLRRLSQEILALPASGNYLSGINLSQDDAKVPVGPAGLFRLPTDSFPQNEVFSTDGYICGSRFSLKATSQHTIFASNPANYIMSTASLSQYGSGFSQNNTYYDPRSSMLLSMPAAGGCSIPVSDFSIGGASFVAEIPRSSNNLRGGMPSGDAGMLFQYGGDYTF